MSDVDPDREALLREAARILIRLNEAPEDPEACAARDAFLARGAAETQAFETALRTFRAGGRARRKGGGGSTLVVLGLLLGLLAAYLYPSMRLALIADWQTGPAVEEIVLASGDRVILDAESAVQDDTDLDARQVTLLQGAGYFDVETQNRSFEVTAGALTARALGTAFEVSRMGDTALVAVAEGVVEVRAEGRSWQLVAGDQILWSPDAGARLSTADSEDVAAWRDDRVQIDGWTFAEAVAVVDRRRPGDIVILGGALGDAPMTGTLDLSQPDAALDVLVASRRARALSAGPFLTILRPGPAR